MEIILISSNESSEIQTVNTEFCTLQSVEGTIYIDDNHAEQDFVIINGYIKFDKNIFKINNGYCFLKDKKLTLYYI